MRLKILLFFVYAFLLSCESKSSNKEEEIAWKACLEANTLSAIDSFLTEFPNTKHKAEIAKKRDAILYRIAVAENTEYHLRNYLREFPQGKFKSEVEKLLNSLISENIDLGSLETSSFVGTLRETDLSNGQNILTMKFSKTDENENSTFYKVTAYLSSNLKKELTAEVSKDKMSIKFAEDQDEEFILGFPDGRFYLRKNEIFIESTDPAAKTYWNLKQIKIKNNTPN